MMVQGGDLLGMESISPPAWRALADPGGICISEAAYGYVRKVLPLDFTDLGPQHGEEHRRTVRAYALKATFSLHQQGRAGQTSPPSRQTLHCCPAVHEHER